jgi:hypothetical protein
MTEMSLCPACRRSLQGGRFLACPACGHDLQSRVAGGSRGNEATRPAPLSRAPRDFGPGSFQQSAPAAASSVEASSTLNPNSAALLQKKAAACRKILWALVLLSAASTLVPALWSYWEFVQLRELVAQHGFGNVPQSRIDAALKPTWVYPASIATLILAGVAFLALIYNSTKILYDIGVSNVKWSTGWTTASIIVPIINFYRPWVGLNETERTLKFLSEKQFIHATEVISARREFGFPTFLYALLFFILSVGDKIISTISAEKELNLANVSNQFEFYKLADWWQMFNIVVFFISLLGILINLFYWEGIFRKMRAAASKIRF